MDFARNLLLKYGWQEGRGLGKLESGISKPIKPKLKFNTEGFGFDPAEQFTNHWWEQAYNTAASNIGVSNTDDGNIAVHSLNKTPSKVRIKRTFISESEKEKLEYKSFKKVAILKNDVLIETGLSSNEDSAPSESNGFRNLTDEELFLACEGRTGHKAARHGHKLNGKLARISDQDQTFSLHKGKPKQCSTNKDEKPCTDEQGVDKKIKIHKKCKKDKQKMESWRDCDLSSEKPQEVKCFETVKKKKEKTKKAKNEEYVNELNCDVNIDNDKSIVEIKTDCYLKMNKGQQINGKAINGHKKKRKAHVLEENIEDSVLSENVNSYGDFSITDGIKIKKKHKKK